MKPGKYDVEQAWWSWKGTQSCEQWNEPRKSLPWYWSFSVHNPFIPHAYLSREGYTFVNIHNIKPGAVGAGSWKKCTFGIVISGKKIHHHQGGQTVQWQENTPLSPLSGNEGKYCRAAVAYDCSSDLKYLDSWVFEEGLRWVQENVRHQVFFLATVF